MEPKLIDINEWVLAGEGGNGQVYNHRSDENIILKLNRENMPKNRAEYYGSRWHSKVVRHTPLGKDIHFPEQQTEQESSERGIRYQKPKVSRIWCS